MSSRDNETNAFCLPGNGRRRPGPSTRPWVLSDEAGTPDPWARRPFLYRRRIQSDNGLREPQVSKTAPIGRPGGKIGRLSQGASSPLAKRPRADHHALRAMHNSMFDEILTGLGRKPYAVSSNNVCIRIRSL